MYVLLQSSYLRYWKNYSTVGKTLKNHSQLKKNFPLALPSLCVFTVVLSGQDVRHIECRKISQNKSQLDAVPDEYQVFSYMC